MGFWSQIEIHVGNICACLPATSQLMKRLWPSLIGTTKGSSNGKGSDGKMGSGQIHIPNNRGNQPRIKEDHDQNFVRLEDFDSKKDSTISHESYA